MDTSARGLYWEKLEEMLFAKGEERGRRGWVGGEGGNPDGKGENRLMDAADGNEG